MFCMNLFKFVYYAFLLLYLYIIIFMHFLYLLFSLCCSVYCLCVLLPPGVNPISVSKYIKSYRFYFTI